MSSDKHVLIKYHSGLSYGSRDSITRTPFSDGQDVVLCPATNSLVSLRGLKELNYLCPNCRNQLSVDLVVVGQSFIPSSDKTKNLVEGRRPTISPAVWGVGVVIMLICSLLAISGVLGSLGSVTSNPTDRPAPTYTHTKPMPIPVSPTNPKPTSTVSPIDSSSSPTSRPTTSSCNVGLRSSDTSQGNILHVKPCSGSAYDLGPLADGAFILGPNQVFLVYVSGSDGLVYVARIGDTTLRIIANLARDYKFIAFAKNENPSYQLSFNGSSPYYITIVETKFNDDARIQIPLRYSQ